MNDLGSMKLKLHTRTQAGLEQITFRGNTAVNEDISIFILVVFVETAEEFEFSLHRCIEQPGGACEWKIMEIVIT